MLVVSFHHKDGENGDLLQQEQKNMETFLIVGFHILRGFVSVVRLVAIP